MATLAEILKLDSMSQISVLKTRMKWRMARTLSRDNILNANRRESSELRCLGNRLEMEPVKR